MRVDGGAKQSYLVCRHARNLWNVTSGVRGETTERPTRSERSEPGNPHVADLLDITSVPCADL